MSTHPAAAEILLHGLIDDAALFPPGDAPMPAAVPAHLGNRFGPHAAIAGRFLCPVSRISELSAALPAELDRPVRLGLIGDTGVDGALRGIDQLETEPRLDLEVIEIRAIDGLDRLPPTVPLFVEGPVALVPSGQSAKLRTGGLSAGAFPSAERVAAYFVRCVSAGIPFKCTAGLHHAVRHTDPATGFHHHGFLNVLVAAVGAASGDDAEAVEQVLLCDDPEVLVERFHGIDQETAKNGRALYRGYGSCSFVEPISDLIALGLLPSGGGH